MDPQDIHHQIDKILTDLDAQTPERSPQPTTGQIDPPYQQQPHTIIDVYVVERTEDEAEEPPHVESTLEPQSQRPHDEPASTTTPPYRPRPHWRVVLLVALVTLMLLAGSVVYAIQLLTPEATITLATTSLRVTTTGIVHVVSGNADPAQQQLPGRVLSSVTMSQARTVPTTGTAHQDARAAYGLLTFYNAAPSVQTVSAGTMLTGADGVQIITDQDAIIPAALMPTEGQATVSAHAAITGPAGNIQVGDVYGPCCRLNVFAANGPFRGGQNARTYQTVTQQDINAIATHVKTSLDQSVQAALQTQVQPTEILITPLTCTQKITPDHAAGEEAAQVQVQVDETCTAMVYTTQAFQALATRMATRDAINRLGKGYITTGVQTTITHVSFTHHGSDLQISCISFWAYPFGPEQQQAIKAMIAGKDKGRATTTLLHLAGVQSVSIALKNSTIIPTDTQHIHFIFLEM